MNIKDTYIHEGPGGTNAKALLKDFSITSTLIVLTRAKLTADGSADETDNPITIPTWNQSTTGNAATATLADKVKGSYTGNGGLLNPNYFGTNKVGFLMMNTTVNGNTQYKDWIIMDCYSGNDVGGGVAFGVNRQSLGAYIMRSASARTSWELSAELLGTHNYNLYAVPLSGGTMTGALTVPSLSVTGAATFSQAINGSILGNAATASRLQNARNIAISGAVTGNANFDGSGNITISTSVSHTHNYAGSGSAGGAATNVVVNSGNDTNSTYPLVWHSGNTLYSTAGVYCNPSTDIVYAKAFYASGGLPGFQITTTATTWAYIRINNGSNLWDIASKSNNESGRLEFRYGGADTAKAGVNTSGTLFSTSNGNTLTIGSINASYCHFQNSVDIPFYFNKTVNVDGVIKIYNTSYQINSSTSVLNDLRVSGNDLYIGSASGSQCHQQYDSTNKVLKFIFD